MLRTMSRWLLKISKDDTPLPLGLCASVPWPAQHRSATWWSGGACCGPMCSYPLTGCHWTELGSDFFTALLQTFRVHTDENPLSIPFCRLGWDCQVSPLLRVVVLLSSSWWAFAGFWKKESLCSGTEQGKICCKYVYLYFIEMLLNFQALN